MTLSKYEQRVLDAIEQDLAARSASTDRRHWWRRPHSTRAVTCCGVVAGLTGAAGLTVFAVELDAANGIGIGAALIGYALSVLIAWSAVSAMNRRLLTRTGQKPARPRDRSPRHSDRDEPGSATAA